MRKNTCLPGFKADLVAHNSYLRWVLAWSADQGENSRRGPQGVAWTGPTALKGQIGGPGQTKAKNYPLEKENPGSKQQKPKPH